MENKDKFLEIEEKKDEAGLGNPEELKRTVCVIGHKNPDTDSICAAISYAYLKNSKERGFHYVPVRAGQISAETQYVLEHFQVEPPVFLDNIGTRVKDMAIRQVPGVRSNISLKNAWNLMMTQNVFTLPITNEENQLKGLITVNDIAKSYMEEYDSAIVSVAKTPYRNILETLDAEMVVGDEEGYFDQGKVVIAAANPDVMENYIEEHDMVILGNSYESQLCAIEMQAGCIVVCLGAPVSRTIQRLARDRNCSIIVTPLDTYAVARLINQSMPVDFFMTQHGILSFSMDDYTDDVKEVMAKERHRYFPVLGENNHYIGQLSKRSFLATEKKQVILVDHNEKNQAVDGVECADILEIIDHHRLGGLESINPVYFRNQPLGCTATIIYQMYCENGIEIEQSIAGLLCSAILSDTLMFRSPTCTEVDRAAAQELAKIAKIDIPTYAQQMFEAGSDLSSRSTEEIFYQDYKTFCTAGANFGVGQITSVSEAGLRAQIPALQQLMKEKTEKDPSTMLFFLLTNIIEENSIVLCSGAKAEEILKQSNHIEEIPSDGLLVPGMVSRKKQFLPSIIATLQQ